MWVYPTYGRPQHAASVIAAMRRRGAEAPIKLYSSADDPEIDAYRALENAQSAALGFELVVMPTGQGWLPDKLNHAFAAQPNEPWYGIVYDDLDILTEFEAQLVGAAGRFGIASANDLFQANDDVRRSRMHGAAVFGGDLLRALGYWLPAGFRHLYIDDVWELIGRTLGNWRVLMHVVTAHHHPLTSGAPMDETYARGNSPERQAEDKARFIEWCEIEAREDMLRAMRAIEMARLPIILRAQERSVLLCLFTYDRPAPECAASLAETRALLTSLGIRHQLHECKGMSLLPIGRNYAARALLASGCTDLLMIDDDMQWVAWDVVKLLASPQEVIAGVGKRKDGRPDSDPQAWCFVLPDDFDGDLVVDEFGAVEVSRVGTAFLRIHRSVFERIAAARPDLWRKHITARGEEAGGYPKAFAITDVNGIEAGEDYSFCNLWRELGGTIWIDPTIRLVHWGRQGFTGEISSIFRLDPADFARQMV